MLKEKFKWLLAIMLMAAGIIFMKNTNKKKEITKIMEHPRIINITNLNDIKEKVEKKDDFILYIGHSLCGDCQTFRDGPLTSILKQEQDIKLYAIDFHQRNKMSGEWDKIIGPKNNPTEGENTPSPTIENFTFYFTPALVFIKDGKAKFDWQDFGGGEKRTSRYFRGDDSKLEEGNQNAKEDVLELIRKWKQG